MSIEALNWALGHMQREELTTNVRFVLMILANRADPEGVCWPSVRYIRARTGLADSTVRECCKKISDIGLLTIAGQARNDGGKGANRYNLCITVPPPPQSGGTPPPQSGDAPRLDAAGVPPQSGGHETKEKTPLPDGNGSPRAPKKFVYPDDFMVSPDVCKWAEERGLLASYVGEQLEHFRDDARANRRLHADWDAAFKNWLRRQPNFDRTAPRPVKGARSQPAQAVDKRCAWPKRDSPLRCAVTSEQDKEGFWLGRGVFLCSEHGREHFKRADAERQAA